MASLIFDLVKTEGYEPWVERCCEGHVKESKSLHLLLVAIATKKLPPQEAFELTSDRRKWETNEKASMEIVTFLDMFNDLISNKEKVESKPNFSARNTNQYGNFRYKPAGSTNNKSSRFEPNNQQVGQDEAHW